LISVTRRVRFSAARRLARADWSHARNAQVYGRWSSPHGHDFALDVSVRGPVPRETGMVVDLKQLKQLIETRVVRHLDRCDLTEAALLEGRVATSENLVMAIWRLLSEPLAPGLELEQVTLHEGPFRSASCRGEP